jgi:hypothetical protein
MFLFGDEMWKKCWSQLQMPHSLKDDNISFGVCPLSESRSEFLDIFLLRGLLNKWARHFFTRQEISFVPSSFFLSALSLSLFARWIACAHLCGGWTFVFFNFDRILPHVAMPTINTHTHTHTPTPTHTHTHPHTHIHTHTQTVSIFLYPFTL